MTSTTHLQNGNPVSNDNNLSGISNTTSTPTLSINQKKTINLQQTNWLNGYSNGNNNNKVMSNQIPISSATSSSAVPAYQRKCIVRGTSNDSIPNETNGDDKSSNESVVGFTNRQPLYDGFTLNRKIPLNGGNELRIDEKNISLHLNNPFITNYMVSSQTSASTSATMPFYRTDRDSMGTTQSVSNPQISNVIKKNQLKNFKISENGKMDFHNDYGGTSDNCIISTDTIRNSRPKRPHSIAGVSASLLLATTITNSHQLFNEQLNSEGVSKVMAPSASATTTMTYSNNYHTVNNNNNGVSSIGNSNSKYSIIGNNNQNVQRMISQAQTNELTSAHVSYGHFINSPSRLTTNRNTQEFSLYTPPPISMSISNNSIQKQQQQQHSICPPNIVQRRSHSTPRPLHAANLPLSASTSSVGINSPGGNIPIIQRPRSLDRATINTLALNKSRPPPIPPSRRFSQSQQQQQQLKINNSPNSVQYPAITSSTQVSASPASLQRPTPMSGMRQSITFHGQLNRHTTNTSTNYTNLNKSDTDTLSGTRRKSDRPLSFAYGTMPDQIYLENQLRIYSEQLRTITESVRKYSEQAKILSEMKRQQQQQQQTGKNRDELKTVPNKNSHIQSDSNIYMSNEYETHGKFGGEKSSIVGHDEPQTPSHQLRLFLDSIRGTIKEPDDEQIQPPLPPIASQQQQSSHKVVKTDGAGISGKTVEAKTPSDQLRQFLDAIRSNQLPDEEQDDLAGAANRFSKFKEKMEHARSKSTPNFDKYQQSSNVNETFTQVSDNLRIMNEDLEALASSPKKPTILSGHNLHMGGTGNLNSIKANVMDFNQILDSFNQLTNNPHTTVDTVDYLRKCSEALHHTSNQLRIATMHNSFNDSPENSSCSTTPGSIREAVQNLLQQPRNGFQIMDDRMKLFIDILDSQSKFSQVNSTK